MAKSAKELYLERQAAKKAKAEPKKVETKSAQEIHAEMQAKLKAGGGGVNPPEAANGIPADSFERKTGEDGEKIETTQAPTTSEAKAAASGKPERVTTANGNVSWKDTALALERYIEKLPASQVAEAPGAAKLSDYSDQRLLEDLERRGYRGTLVKGDTINVT